MPTQSPMAAFHPPSLLLLTSLVMLSLHLIVPRPRLLQEVHEAFSDLQPVICHPCSHPSESRHFDLSLTLNKSLQEVKDYVADICAKVEATQAEVENSKDDLESLKVELDQKTEEIQVFCVVEVGNLSS